MVVLIINRSILVLDHTLGRRMELFNGATYFMTRNNELEYIRERAIKLLNMS